MRKQKELQRKQLMEVRRRTAEAERNRKKLQEESAKRRKFEKQRFEREIEKLKK